MRGRVGIISPSPEDVFKNRVPHGGKVREFSYTKKKSKGGSL
jgi:hypothetical protein